jgi:RNA polymerase sigma factor (sigma-70 family)
MNDIYYFYKKIKQSTMAVLTPLEDMDKNMVILIQKGDKSDYIKLYSKYAPAVLGVLTRTLGSPQQAEECLQELFCKVWEERYNYEPGKERLFTWMLKVAKTCSLFGAVTRENHLDDLIREEIDLIYAMDIKAYLLKKQQDEAEVFAVGIDADIKEAIRLIYFENCSFAAAAEKLEMPVDVLRGKMVKTIKQLKGSVLA